MDSRCKLDRSPSLLCRVVRRVCMSWALTGLVGTGNAGGTEAVVEFSALNDTDGFVINGVAAGDRSGFAVSGLEDVNGDGVDDLLIGVGAPFAGPNSIASYVLFGRTEGFSASLELSALDDTDGFSLYGVAAGDRTGRAVGGLGDVNGDGIDDLLVGAWSADPNGPVSGASYVVFGRTGGFGAALELSALNGTDGFVLNGITTGDLSVLARSLARGRLTFGGQASLPIFCTASPPNPPGGCSNRGGY